jgi:methylenetetrahydrofolate reductase (NADPH)
MPWFKGLGFSGAQIGGPLVTCEQVESVIEKGEELSASWQALIAEFQYSRPGGFYYFQKDPDSGLNKEIPVDVDSPAPDVSGKGLYRFSVLS